MPIKFQPKYNLTPPILEYLAQIESAKKESVHLPLTPTVLNSLRESAQLYTTHYSTMIEGNELKPKEIEAVLKKEEHFPGRVREEHEIKGYYAALQKVELWAAEKQPITEKTIQMLHALVMSNGRVKIKATAYRDGQNVIKDSQSRRIIYLPPEAKDVPILMKSLVYWIGNSHKLPAPVVAGLVHYQFATIHPYYDGNGRTARLLTTLVLHLRGYDLKGLYSLEEYYARNLNNYYEAINIGASHNYYEGREKKSVTPWLKYFLAGMADSFEKVVVRMKEAQEKGALDQSAFLRKLDPRQRKVLKLFQKFEVATSQQIGRLFAFKPRTSTHICAKWVDEGFLEMVDNSNKGRKYRLALKYETFIQSL